MPQSRGRFPRNKSQATRKREQRRCTRLARPQLRFGDDDWAGVRRGIQTEARGDAEATLEMHLAGPHVAGSHREARLREMATLGDDAPAWMLSRWILGQVPRWLLVDNGEEIQRSTLKAFETAYHGVDEWRPMGKEPRTFVAELSSCDWVVNQLATYEYGALRRFLRKVADPVFIARADRIVEWADAPMGGYRFEDVLDDRVLITDLASGRPRQVLNIGSTWAHEGGSTVIGRLVPISMAPGLMFESRPLAVDPMTATEVARTALAGSDEWTVALTRARRTDRLPLGFSTLVLTSYVTDLPGGGVTGLETEGIAESGPEASVALADLVLDQVGIEPIVASHIAMQLVCLLLDPDLRAVVADSCTQGSRRAAWVAISRVLPEPIRAYALDMAEAASARA